MLNVFEVIVKTVTMKLISCAALM